VTRTRESKLFERSAASCLLALVLGCVEAPAGIEAPSASGAQPPRRPDGVVLEPPPSIPTPVTRALAGGVIALREPLGGDAVRELVSSLVDAWEHESLDGLTALLAADAGPIESRARGRSALIESWRQRMHAHEYGRLSGVELVRPERIERYDWDDLAGADAPARPPEMRPDELYVRVPLQTTRVAGELFFQDVILLLLRREEGRYRISAYGEVDAP